jgi:CRP/FNR family transcriptional regulator, dissimilatory nitrate respiration regulator
MDLKRIALFEGVSSADLTVIQSYLHEKTFAKGEVILSEGAPCEKIFIVASGRIKLYRTTDAGKEQILEMLGPGDTCACHPGTGEWLCNTTAEAAAPSTVWFLSRERYAHLVQHHAKISLALNRIFADKLRCLGSLIEEVSLKDVQKRLVKFILDMAVENTAKKETLFIPFTREELAQRIGAARETVTRHLQELKRENLIDIQPHQIIILNSQGLKDLLS